MLRYGQVHRCSCRFCHLDQSVPYLSKDPGDEGGVGHLFGLFFQLSCNLCLDNECNYGLTLMTFEDFALFAEPVLLARYVALPHKRVHRAALAVSVLP